ncbi:transglutaminase family protein [Burkholderia plantarii]|uniref:Transglutaminase-like domain-containing protein n=1 Tax=Burkholderia plantarii TaxID=41899 RepID=A0A0B6S7H2_BURPL|nr:transglutaminase family protein [Burkholderia plantarii]AJK49235.1 hypothetical protein, transglutaminase-like protein [Burkholderia plantarii]
MRLAIRHISRFRFDDHATHALQRLRLRPPSGPGQTVRAWQVTIDGIEPTVGYADGLGNRIDLVRHDRGERPEVVVIAAGVVETQDRAGIVGGADDYAVPWIFERTTGFTQAGERVREIAAALPLELRSLDALHWLMSEVHARIRYVPELADADTDAERALEAGEGTSRDHAHAFIAVARALKIPARYVAGYLLTDGPLQRIAETMQQSGGAQQSQRMQLDADGIRHAAADAPEAVARQQQTSVTTYPPSGHAWAEAYVEGLGWVGFDPFMNRCPDERYVRVAAGLDHTDARPVTGIGAAPVAVEISVIQSPELV